jgi:hypothetical protein
MQINPDDATVLRKIPGGLDYDAVHGSEPANMDSILTSVDLWFLMAAGLVAGGVAAWTVQRRRSVGPPGAAEEPFPLKTGEGIGPPRGRDED